MFETSKDILYIVLSFCILWVTLFLCWLLYYVMRLARNASEIVEEFRVRLQALTDAINYVRGKVEGISNMMTLATQGATGLVKKFVSSKAKQFVDDVARRTDLAGTGLDKAARAAVDKAVSATAQKMKKTAKRLRK